MNEIINQFEEKDIKKNNLPIEWQNESAQLALEKFLQDNWDQRKALYDDENSSTKQQFIEFKAHGVLRTNEYIGTIVFKGQQLNIFPKMFRESEDNDSTSNLSLEHLMNNLIQWLEYCSKYDFPYISIKSELKDVDNLKELFITLFIKKLSKCFERGRYFQYEEKTEDLSAIRGKFDVKDYYTKKFANGILDKFQCTYSSFEFDNLLNKIIKFTCKKIFNETRSINQKELRSILIKLSDVEDVICTAKDCDKIKLGQMHENYRIILSMCKMFLLNSTSKYNIDNSESFCFLFPTNLLFEGFIGGFLQEVIGNRGKIKLQAGEMPLINNVFFNGKSYGKAFTMRHDILCDIPGKGIFILDTKYKQIPRFEKSQEDHELFKMGVIKGVSQSDLYQVSTYAIKRGTDKAYLLYPLYRKEDTEPDMVTLQQVIPTGTLIDSIKTINVYLVRVPFVFEENTEEVKANLKRVIESIFA